QRQLNAIANNYPSIKKLAVDGIYGPKTAESVRTFQRIFDLPLDGRVNFPTWYSISGIYVAVENLA
ncbi:MAG: peptidoglycan-binding protein, partial [Clostridia bacterium]|nr:peptidoglycan-binding protein [Clostridia bacterium]